ncbi:hypothetical protein [Clostridium sp. Marseille-P299]|uniref:hypothetical protein n=1 Tax=Clostridium sp. Marseille-P299 TaxID=1805477 RepID=UPI0008310C33|nr:hypothetical protein [Clostridium sp. Marseille-P299]
MKNEIFILIIIGIVLFLYPPNSSKKNDTSASKMLITQGTNDISIIPDKFNTGIDESISLYIITEFTTYQNIVYTDNGISIVLDLFYRNKDLGEFTIIENIDFSEKPFAIYNDDKVTTKKTIIFRNCKFSKMSTNPKVTNVTYQFKNCTFTNFNGSNATFNKCYFGGTSADGINPYKNVTVKNSYIADLAHIQYDKVVHSDGVQIYGYKDMDATDIHFKNCRFEIPIIPFINSSSAINACLFVGLEYSNANNISFTDCIINGGGFTISVIAKPPFKVSNIVFKNLKLGAAKKFKNIYPNSKKLATFKNVQEISKLYVSSVWRENGTIHLSVTNDTSVEKKLIVITKHGSYEFLVPACYKSSKLTTDDKLTFQDYPFDIEYIVMSSDWVVCYDTSITSENQIRFVNWGTKPVYITKPKTVQKLK